MSNWTIWHGLKSLAIGKLAIILAKGLEAIGIIYGGAFLKKTKATYPPVLQMVYYELTIFLCVLGIGVFLAGRVITGFYTWCMGKHHLFPFSFK